MAISHSTGPSAGAGHRLLFVQSRMEPRGGATAVAAWMLQALQDEWDVTVLTSRAIDTCAINRRYGTSLDASRFIVKTLPAPVRWLADLDPDRGSIQPAMLLMRIAKRLGGRFDLTIGAEMEADFGEPGIQYIHWPRVGHLLAGMQRYEEISAWQAPIELVRNRIRPWMAAGDYSLRRMKKNLTLANSDWTGRYIERIYGLRPVTLYPPAPGFFPDVPWDQRENGFVCIGRLDPVKRIPWIIETLAALRAEVPDLKLHIAGAAARGGRQSGHVALLRGLVRANSAWVSLHEGISRTDLARLVSRQRYGIHARVGEHFGIGIAEMLRAGCVAFVHNSGGAVEVVGHDSRVIYEDHNVLAKIRRVINSGEEQNDLRAGLGARAALFDPERFMEEVRRVVRCALERKDQAGARVGFPEATLAHRFSPPGLSNEGKAARKLLLAPPASLRARLTRRPKPVTITLAAAGF